MWITVVQETGFWPVKVAQVKNTRYVYPAMGEMGVGERKYRVQPPSVFLTFWISVVHLLFVLLLWTINRPSVTLDRWQDRLRDWAGAGFPGCTWNLQHLPAMNRLLSGGCTVSLSSGCLSSASSWYRPPR